MPSLCTTHTQLLTFLHLAQRRRLARSSSLNNFMVSVLQKLAPHMIGTHHCSHYTRAPNTSNRFTVHAPTDTHTLAVVTHTLLDTILPPVHRLLSLTITLTHYPNFSKYRNICLSAMLATIADRLTFRHKQCFYLNT